MAIAYNDELSVQRLTEDLLRLFREAGATEPEQALAAFAESQSRIKGGQFEALLGPLSATADAIGFLPGLAGLAQAAGADDVVRALDTASAFLRVIHDLGLAITLGHIAERSIGGNYDEVVCKTARELIELGPPGDLSVATLNYDGLLHAGIMDAGVDHWGRNVFPIVDLAAGYVEESKEVVPGRSLVGHQIRDFDDLLSGRAAILQLHGSLAWLRDPHDPEAVWRFELQELRDARYWEHLRDGTTRWSPMVVLTDRKERTISNWPFSLAYEIFQRRLIGSDRWLVLGYGLGDVPVNGLFATAVHERMRLGLAIPPTLVIDRDADSEAVRIRSAAALRIPLSSLIACGLGLPQAFESEEWSRWKEG